MLYTKPLTNPTTGKTLTNFEMGIVCTNCVDSEGNEIQLYAEDLEPILKHNHITMAELSPDYDGLITAYRDSDYTDLDEFMTDNYPDIVLESWERNDFIK